MTKLRRAKASKPVKVTERKARPGGRTERNSQLIRDVTLKILREKGYAGLSFQEVAEAAGVSRSTLHRRWDSRAKLALSAMRAAVLRSVTFEDTGSLKGDLRFVMTRIGDFLCDPLGVAVVMATLEIQQTAELPPGAIQRWPERSRAVLPIFERAVARGELPAKFDGEAAIAMTVGSLYFRLIVMGGQPDKAWIERIVDRFVAVHAVRKSQ